MAEDITSFDNLFEPATGEGGGGLAVAQLERIFGSIVRLAQGGEVSDTSDSWLVTAIALFNSAGLLMVTVVSLYTILTVAFDTARDGKAFGQGTDTRYTILRSVMGAIFFIPLSKGFTIAQIALLWLVIQGSALADKAWTLIAEKNISGDTFVQASKLSGSVDAAIASQFADALNALVIGNICAYGLNDINRQVTGDSDADDVIEFQSATKTVVKNQFAVDHRGDDAEKAYVVRRYWKDTSETYRGSDNICGGVAYEQTVTFPTSGTSVFDNIRVTAATKLRANYISAIDGLVSDASSIAAGIRNNDKADDLTEMSVDAVREAQTTFISGLESDLESEDFDAVVQQIQEDAIEAVTEDGWVLAPSWQRGISLATAEYRSTLGSLSLNVSAENNSRWFLSNNSLDSSVLSWRDENPIAAQVTAQMAEQENSWATVAGRVLKEVRHSGAGMTGMANNGEEVDGVLNKLFSLMIDAMAVRDDSGYSDPMVDVTEYGHGLMLAGGMVAAAAKATEYAPAAGAMAGGPVGYGVGKVVSDIGETVLSPLGWGLLAAGFITASIIPLLPVVYYFSAVVSWLILVVESMFALPLAVLTLFTPSRSGTLIGSWNRILLTIFGVFLRPIFTVIGFFFGMLLIAVALDLAYTLFQDMLRMMQPQGAFIRVFGLFGIVIAFVVVSFYTVLLGSGMITQIGDGAMAAIGVAFSGSQGEMNVGSRTDNALGVGRAIQPIRPGRLGGDGGAAGRLPSAPAQNGGGGGGAALIPGVGARGNIAAMGLRGPGAVKAALNGAAPRIAGQPKGARLTEAKKTIQDQFSGKRKDSDTGSV